MNSLPKHVAVVMALLAGLACVAAGAAQVEILAPAQQDIIHDNAGNLAVEVKVERPIDAQDGRSVRILLDGKPAAPDSVGMSFALRGVERGQHRLQALLIGAEGQTLAVSDTIDFTMWQASIKNPVRPKKK